MQQFAELLTRISESTKTLEKQAALADYFQAAVDADKIWALALFTGRRLKRVVNSNKLREWCAEVAGLPLWLFEETYHAVGDLGETIAHILPEPSYRSHRPLNAWMDFLKNLENLDELGKKTAILDAWDSLAQDERFAFNKLIGGNFRIGVSQAMVVNALAKVYTIDSQALQHRISGQWSPETTTFDELLTGEHIRTDASKPYPFFLAYAIEASEIEGLGSPSDWQVEWKWDGIRGQIVRRQGDLFVWSRGEDLITEKFPEYLLLRDSLPDGTVLDGEIIPWRNDRPLPFQILQTRIGRKNVTKKNLEEAPAVFLAYDVLEWQGEDVRSRPMEERRTLLERLVAQVSKPVLLLSPKVDFNTWNDLKVLQPTARERSSEGFMLKRKSSIYQAGRRRGDWWKWKIDPLTIDCVMVAAQKGHGRRASLFTDYTFAVRDGERLVTFTKAYSGLTDKEFVEVDAWIKKHILEKFGPVRTVKPELVFEIAFEGIAASNRHKSGVALRFPRIARWRMDKTLAEINTLADLKEMLGKYGTGG